MNYINILKTLLSIAFIIPLMIFILFGGYLLTTLITFIVVFLVEAIFGITIGLNIWLLGLIVWVVKSIL